MPALLTVLDTNVMLAAQKAASPGSPCAEVLERWRSGEHVVIYSDDVILEYAEKLVEHGIPEIKIARLLKDLRLLGHKVGITHFHLRHYPVDADDIAFLLCALNGRTSHLVSYDDHLLVLRHHYLALTKICEPIEFLNDLRSHLSRNP